MNAKIGIGGMRRVAGALVAAALCAAAAPAARAAGLLIADGGFGGVLDIVEHDVHVTINNGVAVTRVTQVFHNTENRQVEALYTFPVPEGASVANFSMWINGKEMVGEVVEKERAREIYNSYKQQKRDPGLLEQNDYKSFEMRIFPIAANADQKVEVAYYQELKVDHDWATYVYPLATVTRAGLSARTTGRFAIRFETRSPVPIARLESPSHGEAFVIAQHDASTAEASLEAAAGSLERDVVLAYRLARPVTGLDMITSREKGEDGYYCLTLTVGEDLAKLDTGMDYVFVMDISGSMAEDQKLAMSRRSVAEFVKALGAADRFEVLTFNIQPTTLFGALRAAAPAAMAEAERFLDGQAARGGTVLKPAIDAAYRYADADRPLNVVILSDGMTEQRERRELLTLISQRPRNARVFCIGVGNEVNRPLLEQLAHDSGGLAAFVSRGDSFERQAEAFKRKLMRPAARGVAIAIDGVPVYDVEPRTLPDLYCGAPIKVYGRYRGGGEATVTITADVRGLPFRQAAVLSFPEVDAGNPEIERMWAWRRIDNLLKEADRSGARAAVADEVIALGEGYSIVTEYTSFLVLENDAEYQRWKIDRRNRERFGRDRLAQEQRRAALDAIRARAVADVGPQLAQADAPSISVPGRESAPVVPAATPRAPQTPAPRAPGQGVDLNFGTGPVGPLMLALAAWMRRRRVRG